MTEQLPFHFSLSCVGEGNGNPLQYSCLENFMAEIVVRRPSSGRAPGAPTARATRPDTHADDGGHEQQHQHGHVEDDDTQQQEQHSGGGFCSAEFPSALTGDTAELDVRSG